MKRLVGLARRHRWRVLSVLVAAVGLLAFGVIYFAPQDLLINTSVDDPLPTAQVRSVAVPVADARPPTTARPVILRHGSFHSGEHATTGTARLLRVADGRTFIRLEDLSTSNGPAVRVWLTSAIAPASNAAVQASSHLDLGGLKANHGNQNYAVPVGARLRSYRSVVLWCARFDVVFGSAPLLS